MISMRSKSSDIGLCLGIDPSLPSYAGCHGSNGGHFTEPLQAIALKRHLTACQSRQVTLRSAYVHPADHTACRADGPAIAYLQLAREARDEVPYHLPATR